MAFDTVGLLYNDNNSTPVSLWYLLTTRYGPDTVPCALHNNIK